MKKNTCLVGNVIVLINSFVVGLICKILPPSKTATHKFPSLSIVIPSGTPGIPCFSKSNTTSQLSKKRFIYKDFRSITPSLTYFSLFHVVVISVHGSFGRIDVIHFFEFQIPSKSVSNAYFGQMLPYLILPD